MKKTRKKRCRYCGCSFRPDPRASHHQYSCSKAACRRKSKRDSQKRWTAKNPDYFAGRYASSTKPWLEKHPGYLKHYRKVHPEYVEKNREKQKIRDRKRKNRNLDIQDVISLQSIVNTGDKPCLAYLDIQDLIMTYPIVITGLISYLRNLDIQDMMDMHVRRVYNRGRFLARQYSDL